MKKATVIEVIAFLFMALFLYAGLSKLLDYRVFSEQISESPILAPVAPVFAIGLPVVEIFLVLLFFLPKYRLLSLYSCLALMILFTLYIIGIMSFLDHLPCSCGGVLSELTWSQHLIFNGFFIILATIAITLERSSRKDIKKTTPYQHPKQAVV